MKKNIKAKGKYMEISSLTGDIEEINEVFRIAARIAWEGKNAKMKKMGTCIIM